MATSSQKLPYTICTPWQLPDACSRTVNRYCLYSSLNESHNSSKGVTIIYAALKSLFIFLFYYRRRPTRYNEIQRFQLSTTFKTRRVKIRKYD